MQHQAIAMLAFSNNKKTKPIKKLVSAIYYDFRTQNFCHISCSEKKNTTDFMMQLRKVFCQLNFLIKCSVVLYFFSLGRNQKAIPE
jgi:hypothetical protein